MSTINRFGISLKLFMILSILVFLLGGCYEPKIGCLDLLATNYDTTADENCCHNETDCCCTYPKLKIKVKHKIDTLNLVLGDFYTNELGQEYAVTDWQFYLSNFHLASSTDTLLVADTITILDESGNDITIEDNFQIINRSFDYTIGTINRIGDFDKIIFNIGIPEPVNKTDPESISSSHPLSIQSNPMHWSRDSGYIFNKVIFLRDTFSSTLPDTIEIGLPENLVTVELDFSTDILEGFDFTVSTLLIDYAIWYNGIDFELDSKEMIATKIIENTTEAFSISE